MSNVEPSTPGTPQTGADPDLYKSPQNEIEGLESFDDASASAEVPPSSPPPPPVPPPSPPPPPSGSAQPSGGPSQAATAGAGRPRRAGRRRSFSVFWPLLLIMFGGLLLLQNLGYFSGLSWGTLWRFWPLLLIAAGIDTLIGRRSAWGSILSALLILALLGGAIYLVLNASSFPWMAEFVKEPDWKSEQVSHPLAGVEWARVDVDWASVPLRLQALEDSSDLIEGTVVYRGRLNFHTDSGRRTTVELSTDPMGTWWFPGTWVGPSSLEGQEQRWTLGLSPRVPIQLELDGGSGSAQLDLRGLELEELGLDVASGAVDLYLPLGEYDTSIEGGSGALDMWLPRETGVVLVVDGGSGALRLGERFRLVEGERDGDGTWESDNLVDAEQILSIYLDVASGRVRVQDWE